MHIKDCRDRLLAAGYVKVADDIVLVGVRRYEFEKTYGGWVYSIWIYSYGGKVRRMDCFRRQALDQNLRREGLCTCDDMGGMGLFMYDRLPAEGVVRAMCRDPDHIVAELGRVSVEKMLKTLG